MEKIGKLKNKKLNFSIVILFTMILVLICTFVLLFYVNEYRKYKTVESNFYYYYSKNKVDFTANVTINSKDKILSVQKEGLDLTLYPLYYQEEDKMVLPKNTEIVYPYKSKSLFKLGTFSEVYSKKEYVFVDSEYGQGRLYDCFLYDGDNLYVFIEPTVLIIGDTRYNLDKLSYVFVNNIGVEIYNKTDDTYVYVDNTDMALSVSAYTEEYMINLINDTYEYSGEYYSLIKNVDGLDSIEF